MRRSAGTVWWASREEIAALGDLATQDPLSLATQRYAQLRRFAPAFLEAFEFDAPASGQGLQATVTLLRDLNRTGKRNLPDIVPMPFPSQHWKTVIPHNATPQRRTYETAVVATLRDRLRAGDVWVEGSQDDRRFDAYLVPMDETQRVLGDSTLETDGPAWLTGRRERLHDRLREVRAKLAAGRLEGVRLENSRLKNHSVRSAHPARGRTPRPRDRWAYAAHPDHRSAVGCERPDGLQRMLFKEPQSPGRLPLPVGTNLRQVRRKALRRCRLSSRRIGLREG